jgi:hypothetical protein
VADGVVICTVVVVLQSASLSLARGEDRAPDFHGQASADGEESPYPSNLLAALEAGVSG